MAEEFERGTTRPEFPLPPPMPFPECGTSEADVIDDLARIIDENPYPIERNFGVSYVGPPHPITQRAAEVARGTFFVEWGRTQQPASYRLEKEAVRMMASLFGKPDAVGFITSGGTESNVSALRLARNLARKKDPEIVMPESAHYSFRIAAELMGIHVNEVPLDSDYRPRMDEIERAINGNTVALVCSAPEGHLGLVDPVSEFAEIAERHGVYLHVDGAFGGFFLPFLSDLGIEAPAFDFTLPGVSSIMTDGHKLGLLPVATGFFIVRDEAMLDAIPTPTTVIHNLTATKPGDHAAAAWTVMKHLGRAGYAESARNLINVVDIVSEGVERIDGIRLLVKPMVAVINITSDEYDVRKIHNGLRSRGWGSTYGRAGAVHTVRLSIHPARDEEHAHGFIRALEESVQDARP
ncbi:MAG: aminotransferase class V-fold PLP-dependent enzyme [Chloroflexi bacterium]|nr:aminotransferase class V-fold PLP-dependent enzyme [Chloroflexota bacterium]